MEYIWWFSTWNKLVCGHVRLWCPGSCHVYKQGVLIILCFVQTRDQWRAADSDLADAGQEPWHQDHHPRDQGNIRTDVKWLVHEAMDNNFRFRQNVHVQAEYDCAVFWLAQNTLTSLRYRFITCCGAPGHDASRGGSSREAERLKPPSSSYSDS